MQSNQGDRLKEERLRIGLSQVDFVTAIGSSKTTVFSWEKGETFPNSIHLEKMHHLGMDIQYIVTGERKSFLIGSINSTDEFLQIPVYPAEVCAGNGIDAFDQDPLYHHAFRKDWIKLRGFTPSELAIIKIKGDSMEPVLQNGEYVLLNRGSKQPKTGCIYVVRIGTELLAKYVEMQIGGNIVLRSKNTFYHDIVISPSEMENSNVEILGEIVQGSREYIN